MLDIYYCFHRKGFCTWSEEVVLHGSYLRCSNMLVLIRLLCADSVATNDHLTSSLKCNSSLPFALEPVYFILFYFLFF